MERSLVKLVLCALAVGLVIYLAEVPYIRPSATLKHLGRPVDEQPGPVDERPGPVAEGPWADPMDEGPPAGPVDEGPPAGPGDEGPWAGQRVAWIIPYFRAASLPAYASLFLRTVAASSPHLQLFLFYENATMLLPQVESENIHYINLRPGEITERLWKAFRQECSHWAWGDMDTLVGDMGRLIKAEDLRQFDIITLNRGNGFLYLFGQFSVLANRPELLEAWKWVPNVVDLALVNTSVAVHSWMPKGAPWAWDEVNFSNWANYNSSLFVKMLPLQIWGHEGRKNPEWVRDHTLVWADGRLLVHSTLPEKWELPAQVVAPLLWQSTWTKKVQRPGPYIVERRGMNNNTVWYGSNHEAAGYDQRTQEYALFHFNYEHEFKIPSELAAKRESELSAEGREELRALVQAPRLTWRYEPFDFFAAPPCDAPGGGHCPSHQPASPVHNNVDHEERKRPETND